MSFYGTVVLMVFSDLWSQKTTTKQNKNKNKTNKKTMSYGLSLYVGLKHVETENRKRTIKNVGYAYSRIRTFQAAFDKTAGILWILPLFQ